MNSADEGENGSKAAENFDDVEVLEFKWATKNQSPALKEQFQVYLDEYQAYGILIKERGCAKENGTNVYSPVYKRKGKDTEGNDFVYHVPFKVGSEKSKNPKVSKAHTTEEHLTNELPTICNSYAPLQFYHKQAVNKNTFPLRDNMCVELYALLKNNTPGMPNRKIRLAVAHLRRQNPVVCDLLLMCSVSVMINVKIKGELVVYKPYDNILMFAKAFAEGTPLTTDGGFHVQYNDCREPVEGFRCSILTMETTTVLSASVGRHKGFWFYPGQSHFASFGQLGAGNRAADDGDETMTDEEAAKFRKNLQHYFNPPEVNRDFTWKHQVNMIDAWKRPTATVATVGAVDVPVIDQNLWFVLKKLNGFHFIKLQMDGETQSFTRRQRLAAVTKFLQPEFKDKKPMDFKHETARKRIEAAVEAFNAVDGNKHNVMYDVEVFVAFQAYMILHFALCPSIKLSTRSEYFVQVLDRKPTEVNADLVAYQTALVVKLDVLHKGIVRIEKQIFEDVKTTKAMMNALRSAKKELRKKKEKALNEEELEKITILVQRNANIDAMLEVIRAVRGEGVNFKMLTLL
jgi:hypothetical protein